LEEALRPFLGEDDKRMRPLTATASSLRSSGKLSGFSPTTYGLQQVVIQFSLTGLAFFAATLIIATVLSTYGLHRLLARQAGSGVRGTDLSSGSGNPSSLAPADTPPWGELLLSEIRMERPEEYLAFDCSTNRQATWVFPRMKTEQVRAVVQSYGFTAAQIERALSPRFLKTTGTDTTIKPDDELLFSLSPEARSALYRHLARYLENPTLGIPWVCTKERLDTLISNCKMDATAQAAFKKLLYTQNGQPCFADQEPMLRQLSLPEQRKAFIQSILRQKSVLVRLHLRPETDIDKLIGYWVAPASGVRYKDIRPLLESLKRLPEGGNISLLYFLPPFARQRLYTFPFLTGAGENKENCHWTTMNFFNDPPDDRFFDLGYMNKFLHENYYQIASATAYGDVILLLDAQNNLIHSAVHIADDIVFTKNGNSYQQPWVLMHLKDLLEVYAATPGVHASVWRNKTM
jgi:hypothetical protein